MPVEGLELVGPLPGRLQSPVSFAGGLATNAGNCEGGRAFLRLLQSPDAKATWISKGIEMP